MTLEAAEPMPAVIGWHPWFRRVAARAASPVGLAFAADAMLVRDADGHARPGERVAPPPGPWDDAFTGSAADPVLEWPGRLRLDDLVHLPVVGRLHEPEHAVCVEPQSGPPDGRQRTRAGVVEPGAPLTHVDALALGRGLG